jgi:alkyl hydroperoxide reductase subunit AhpC
MAEPIGVSRLGQRVPDFELETYEPSTGSFGKFRMADQVANKRWTILFFYPADYMSRKKSEVCPSTAMVGKVHRR